jgi:hypothetical protein
MYTEVVVSRKDSIDITVCIGMEPSFIRGKFLYEGIVLFGCIQIVDTKGQIVSSVSLVKMFPIPRNISRVMVTFETTEDSYILLFPLQIPAFLHIYVELGKIHTRISPTVVGNRTVFAESQECKIGIFGRLYICGKFSRTMATIP